jgi:tetratricopeptide (TPR) repeat protein
MIAIGNRAIYYYKAGRYENALKDFNVIISSNTKDDNAYFNRGETYMKLEEKEKAIEDFKKSSTLGNYRAKAKLRELGI